MDGVQISQNVIDVIQRWQQNHNSRQGSVQISPKAIFFLIELIENITADPSPFWSKNEKIGEIPLREEQQLQAIYLIPSALDSIVSNGRIDFITTWELWHSMSKILDRMCFISKDI